MSVVITSIKYQDDYTGAESGNGSDLGVTNLMGYPGDFCYAVGTFYVAWSMLDKQMIFNVASSTIIITNTLFSFIQQGFNVGDTIAVTGAGLNNGSYTISALTDSVITVDAALAADATNSSVNIYGTTPINALNFYYNLIGNNDQLTFRSLTDSEGEQKFTGVVSADYYYYGTDFTLEPNSTSRAWWDEMVGSVSCKPIITDLGTSADYKQQFSFVFPFLVKPFYRNGQLQAFKNAYAQSLSTNLNTTDFIPPSYFFEQVLKPVFKIEGKYELTSDPTHTSFPQTSFANGNTNWFNSFFPTGTQYNGQLLTEAQFKLSSIAYVVDGNAANEIDFNHVTTVTLIITNISGGYSFIEDPYVLNFMWLPVDAGKVQGYSKANEKTYREVFLHDRCKTIAGDIPANGDKFGTDTQALTNTTSVVAGNQLTVTFDIDLGTLSKSVFQGASEADRNYMIWIAPQGNGVSEIKHSNRTSVIADVNLATTNTDDSTLLEIVTNGGTDVEFYKAELPTRKTDFNGFATDYGYAECWFNVKENCIIQNINVSFEVQSSQIYTGVTDTFPIEIWNNDVSGYWNGKLTDVRIIEKRNFNLPETDIKNTRFIIRRAASDSAGFYGYRLVYGFQLGYQFWQTINEFPVQYLGYHTQYWPIYTQGKAMTGSYLLGDYNTELKFKIVWGVLDNATGVVTQFIRYCDVSCSDMAGNYSDFNSNLEIQDIEGNNIDGNIVVDAPVFVSVFMESKTGAFVIGSIATIGELICYYEDGNKTVCDRILTIYSDPETNLSAWVEPPTIFYTDFQVNIRGQLNFSSFQTKPKNVRIYAKIYY